MSSLNGVPASLQFIYALLPSCKGWLLTLGMYLVAVAGVEGGRVGLQTLGTHVLDCRLCFAFFFGVDSLPFLNRQRRKTRFFATMSHLLHLWSKYTPLSFLRWKPRGQKGMFSREGQAQCLLSMAFFTSAVLVLCLDTFVDV